MNKGQSASDVKKQIVRIILDGIKTLGEVNVNKYAAHLSLETGYSFSFVMDIFNLMELAERIFINEQGNARFTQAQLDNDVLSLQTPEDVEKEADKIFKSEPLG